MARAENDAAAATRGPAAVSDLGDEVEGVPHALRVLARDAHHEGLELADGQERQVVSLDDGVDIVFGELAPSEKAGAPLGRVVLAAHAELRHAMGRITGEQRAAGDLERIVDVDLVS